VALTFLLLLSCGMVSQCGVYLGNGEGLLRFSCGYLATFAFVGLHRATMEYSDGFEKVL
jgi:hypothetical protein